MKKVILAVMAFLSVLFNVASVDAACVEWASVSDAEATLRKEAAVHNGQEMVNGQEGCTEAAVLLGSSVSSVLREAREAGIVYNPTLIEFVRERNIAVVEFSNDNLDPGDIIMFGDEKCSCEHAMIYLGNGDMAGNYSYLHGKNGRGGIWTTKLASYKTWKPQLILKTGAPYRMVVVSVVEDGSADTDDCATLVVLFVVLLGVVRMSLAVRASSATAPVISTVVVDAVVDVVTEEPSVETVSIDTVDMDAPVDLIEQTVEDDVLIQVVVSTICSLCSMFYAVVLGRGDPPGLKPRAPILLA